MADATRIDFLKLHLVILLWGFTAILGALMVLPPIEVVLIRSGFASVLLAVALRRRLRVSVGDAGKLVANGALIGLHWVLFFASARVANVSVCMVGLATVSLWTAVLEPMMVADCRVKWRDVGLGILVIACVMLIGCGNAFQLDPQLGRGLLLAVLSALVAAVFSIINGRFVSRVEHRAIVAYEMAGAFLFCGGVTWVQAAMGGMESTAYQWPSLADWGWLFLLITVCTVYAYSQYVELLNRLSVFTINFANNMEPIYGILLGALIFRDYEQVDSFFYLGTTLIALFVLIQPSVDRLFAAKPVRVQSENE